MENFTITLAKNPSASLLVRINYWLKAEIEDKVKLKVVIDKEVIGGAIIEYSGRYKDFSLLKILERSDLLS